MWLLKHQQLHSGGFDSRPPGGWQLNRLTIHKPQPITTLQYYAIYCNTATLYNGNDLRKKTFANFAILGAFANVYLQFFSTI